MSQLEKKGICFVIAPIGEEGSETRQRSDQVLKHIISPVVKNCGYEPVRADNISEPGLITSQVIGHLLDDPLVIADLTDRNPNVFYELAIRHAVRKPIVQLIQTGDSIPFDVAQIRTIQLDHRNLDSVERCKEELFKQVKKAEANPGDVDTPISNAIDLQSWRQSENPLVKSSAEIIVMLQELRQAVGEFSEIGRYPRVHPMMVEELFELVERLNFILDGPENEQNPNVIQEAKRCLRRIDRPLRSIALGVGMPQAVIDGAQFRRMKRNGERL